MIKEKQTIQPDTSCPKTNNIDGCALYALLTENVTRLYISKIDDQQYLVQFNWIVGNRYYANHGCIHEGTKQQLVQKIKFHCSEIDWLAKQAADIVVENLPERKLKSYQFKSNGEYFTMVEDSDTSVILYSHSNYQWMKITPICSLWNDLEDEGFNVDMDELLTLGAVEFNVCLWNNYASDTPISSMPYDADEVFWEIVYPFE